MKAGGPGLPPIEKKKKGGRGRSATPLRGRSVTPLMRHREKSCTPGAGGASWRSITPFLQREDKEKTPFEIGPNILLQLASCQAIFDKALVMDVSECEESRAKYLTCDNAFVDKAFIMDISNVEYIYIEDDDLEPTPAAAPLKSAAKWAAPKPPVPKSAVAPSVAFAAAPKITTTTPAGATSGSEQTGASTDAVTTDTEGKDGTVVKKKRKMKKRKKRAEGEEPKKKKMTKAQILAAKREAEKKAKAEAKALAAKLAAEAEAKRKAEEAARKKAEEEEAERRRIQEEEEAAAAAALAEEEEEVVEEEQDHENSSSRSPTPTGSESEEDMREPSPDNFVRPSLDHGQWDKLTEEEQSALRAAYDERVQAKYDYKMRYRDFQRRREEARNPHVAVHLRDTAVPEGKNAKLTCNVTGPGLVVKWLRDGHVIERSPKYRTMFTEGMVCLEIINPLPSDSGEYSCRVSNENGDAGTSCILTVYDVVKHKPSPPVFSVVRGEYMENSFSNLETYKTNQTFITTPHRSLSRRRGHPDH